MAVKFAGRPRGAGRILEVDRYDKLPRPHGRHAGTPSLAINDIAQVDDT